MPALNIYLVEDNPLIAATIKHVLKSMGHQVCGISECYEDAVVDLERLSLDLVITDIMLKGPRTGIDLGRYIKNNFDTPFIYQSSITDEAMMQEAMNTQPSSYLRKPISRESLYNAMALLS